MHKRADTNGCVWLAYCINSLYSLDFRTGKSIFHLACTSRLSEPSIKNKGGHQNEEVTGRGWRTRTTEMQESNSCALPLRKSPFSFVYYYIIFCLFCQVAPNRHLLSASLSKISNNLARTTVFDFTDINSAEFCVSPL